MKYHIQDKVTKKWLENYAWNSDHWVFIWSTDRANAKPLDRTNIGMLINEGELKDTIGDGYTRAFRAEFSDVKAPDGVVSIGRRIVRKNGVVRFAGGKFRHDKIVPYVGQYIFIEADEYWIIHPHAYKTREFNDDSYICDLDAVEEVK